MFDTNWELIDGETAHEIEVLNLANQANVIEALVRFFLHHQGADDQGCHVHPNATAMKELHRTATFLLLARPGELRASEVHVGDGAGNIVLEPPAAELVPGLLEQFFGELGAQWKKSTPLEIGALALWMVNWIHPFLNGNGRTARALCYTCVSLKFGFVLPGSPTLIDLIMENRPEYYTALQAADQGYTSDGKPNLDLLVALLDRLLIQQFESVNTAA
ncbi:MULTISPECIES: Fic family protein [unclassified Sphingomonas]|uniref:Fic family protein n=1 Tax=unclassified Sphingomonas TaxID=196159 RepID=UPI0009EAB442|nr:MULTISPECIES: Fic family protein [unclassified Sphingomonas]